MDEEFTPLQAFDLLDLRVGRITRVEINAKARKPAYKLWIDFGPLGVKTSSAQLTDLYRPEDLLDRLILAWGPGAAMFGVVAIVVFSPYAITRRRHEDIAADLRGRRTAARAGPDEPIRTLEVA